MFLTVIVPTYRRPKDLERCLTALKQQTRPADEVLVVVRDTDTQTWEFFNTFNSESLPLRLLTVTPPGAIAAMNIGLDAAQGDTVSFTDDDAAPHADWLARIEAHFLSDSQIGGVGGRDFVYRENRLFDGAREVVGRVQWFGRTIGNHHLGVGAAREVDILKGVNMSFRRSAIQDRQFDRRMRGTSAQIHFEIEFCLALKEAGWKLIYDPEIAVDHYQGKRFDEDQRDRFNALATENIIHNHTLALLEHLPPPRHLVFLLWAMGVGTRGGRGFLQWLRFLPREGTLSTQKFLACMRGRWEGWQTWRLSSKHSKQKMV
jgi:cellulose synthase/poly-beta-1,6-N-acetylglucosamine synthase-like glycosyltransferase